MNKRAATILLLVSITYSPYAFSQNNQNTPLITVTNPTVISIDDQSAVREKARTTPGAAQVVDNKSWNTERASTIEDITEFAPSVFVRPRNGAEAARLSIRGSGLASLYQGRGVQIMQNGIPITQADGEFEFQSIDPWLINYASVFPGANALEYGASTFGGAINLVTPTGQTQKYTQIKGERGSFDTWHSMVSGGQIFKNSDIFAAGSYFAQQGDRDQNKQYSVRFDGNAGYKSSESMSHRFYLAHTSSNAEIPGTLSMTQFRQDDEQGKPINVARAYSRDLDLTRMAYKNAIDLGGGRIENTFFYTHRDLDNPVFTYIDKKSHDMGLRTSYSQSLGLNKFTGGINVYYGTNAEDRYDNNGGQAGNLILRRNTYALTNEAYGQYEHHLGNAVYAIGSLQLAYSTREIDEKTPITDSQKEDYFGLNPRIGLRWDAAPTTQIFTNLSRSFEPPTLGDLSGGNSPGFKELDAQRGTIAEIGARWIWQDIRWQLAYYHGWLEDELVNYQFPDGTSDTVNANTTQRDGIELGLGGTLARGLFETMDSLSLQGAYTYSNFRLHDDAQFGDNTLPGMPEHFGRAEIMYNHSSGISLGPTMQAASPTQVDLTNTLETPGYAIYGAKVNWQSNDQRLSLYLEGKNLTDKDYITTIDPVPDAGGTDGNYFYPGEGRAFYAGFNIKF